MQRPTTPRARDPRSGYSLVELMVSVAVMALVTTLLLQSFSRQHTVSVGQERLVETQEEARVLVDLIVSDLRMAGFMLPAFAAIGSNDGGTSDADIVCMSDASVIDEATLPSASSRFTGAPLASGFSGSVSSVSVNASDRDIDADGDDDFTVGGGILIGTGSRVHCAVVRSLSSSAITFSPATPSAFAAAADDVVVPAVVYRLNGTTLTRNSTVLSDRIEDLQIQYGVDADSNGTVEGAEFPIDDLTGQDFDLIETARVSLTARDPRPTERFAGRLPAAANRVAGAADNFKRRRVIGDALLRNLQ
jgi:prepilin-type N-terminal cleavage/methylation domain-containing protein